MSFKAILNILCISIPICVINFNLIFFFSSPFKVPRGFFFYVQSLLHSSCVRPTLFMGEGVPASAVVDAAFELN